MHHYRGSFLFTLITLTLGFGYGLYIFENTLQAFGVVATMAILGVLEVSLSFDNAVVNARVLKTMSDIWKQRFLTWGIAIAVFGMRIVFPILIVSLVGHIGIFDALSMAVNDPQLYATTLTSSHNSIAGFGGAFLFLVAFGYFFNAEKDVHWIAFIEKQLVKFGEKSSIGIILTLALVYGFYSVLQSTEFLIAAIFGIITHELVHLLGSLMGSEEDLTLATAKNGLASFLYLEVLDASFSFDGVIGAFVLSTNIFIIAGGLGIGAYFVRSMTIHLVESDTLAQFKYLEHGAFWSILVLASIMFASTLLHIPEAVTGLLSVALIGIAVVHSIYEKKRELAN